MSEPQTTTSEAAAVEIVGNHWANVWRWKMAKQISAESGRRTNAKQRELEIATAVYEELKAIVVELRAAGYTVKD